MKIGNNSEYTIDLVCNMILLLPPTLQELTLNMKKWTYINCIEYKIYTNIY